MTRNLFMFPKGAVRYIVETTYVPVTNRRPTAGHRCAVWVLMGPAVGARHIETVTVPLDYSAHRMDEVAARAALVRVIGGAA